jgi:hypothetical protein
MLLVAMFFRATILIQIATMITRCVVSLLLELLESEQPCLCLKILLTVQSRPGCLASFPPAAATSQRRASGHGEPGQAGTLSRLAETMISSY